MCDLKQRNPATRKLAEEKGLRLPAEVVHIRKMPPRLVAQLTCVNYAVKQKYAPPRPPPPPRYSEGLCLPLLHLFAHSPGVLQFMRICARGHTRAFQTNRFAVPSLLQLLRFPVFGNVWLSQARSHHDLRLVLTIRCAYVILLLNSEVA